MQNIAKFDRAYIVPPVKSLFTPVKILLLLFLLLPFISHGQNTNATNNSTLFGRVLDAVSKEPLPGAAVKIEGTTHAVSTDLQGKFNFITAQKFPYKLVVTYIGYERLELIIDNSNPVDILLKEAAGQLNDVVVVGYGTQRRKDITGSVASVPLFALQQPAASLDKALQGTISGIQVTQATGQPGAGVTVQIRGVNSINAVAEPLYVIDGFPTSNSNSLTDAGVTNGPKINPLSFINNADIESIEVLKDASATAIYGTRGANGVIIITTKKGKSGVSSINYDGNIGWQNVTKTIPLLNTTQWEALRNDALVNSGKTPQTDAVLNPYNVNTDWQGAAFRQAFLQNHSLSVLSGTDRTRLAFAGNYLKQDGILNNTNFKRISGRVNVEHNYNDNLKLTAFVTGAHTEAQIAPAGVIPAILLMTPSTPVYNADGTFFLKNIYEGVYGNPINTLYNQLNQTITNRILGNISADYKITKGLTARVLFGVDIIDNKQNRYLPSTVYEGSGFGGIGEVGSLYSTNWLNENTLTYTKRTGKHAINVLVGYTQQAFNAQTAIAGSYGFVSDFSAYNNLGSGNNTSITSGGFAVAPSSSSNQWALNSYLARVNYGFNDKYLVTLTLRADGSSKFAAGHQWASFPSAAFAWNASSEDFIKDVNWISQLKLRASAGSTGNSDIDSYKSYSQLGSYRYNFGNTTTIGFAPNSLYNPNLTWEKTAQYDLGFDLGVLKDRISVVADVYYKKTSNLLLYLPLPATSGLTIITNTAITNPQQYENVGSVENKGFELNINSHNIVGAFQWNTNLVFAVNRNKVLSLGGNGVNQFIPDSSLPSILKVGEPIGSFIGYKTNGLIQAGGAALTPAANSSPGGQAYVDFNNDGKITQASDRTILGNAQPKFTGGITNTFNYKGVDFSFFLQTSYGNRIYNQQRAVLELGTGYTNSTTTLLNRWTTTNTNTDVHSAFQDPAATISDRFIEDGSYLRLKTLSLGYTFPQSLLKKSTIKKVRVYLTAQNLATWTKYTGYDPEVSSNEQSSITLGVDNGAYPNSKSIVAGVSLSL